jgi:MFS family permease
MPMDVGKYFLQQPWCTLTSRPIFIINLILYILSCIGTALCPTNAFWLLLVLRIVQVSEQTRLVPLQSV